MSDRFQPAQPQPDAPTTNAAMIPGYIEPVAPPSPSDAHLRTAVAHLLSTVERIAGILATVSGTIPALGSLGMALTGLQRDIENVRNELSPPG